MKKIIIPTLALSISASLYAKDLRDLKFNVMADVTKGSRVLINKAVMQEDSNFKIPEKVYSADTFKKISDIHAKAKKKDRTQVYANKVIANTIDYFIVPVVDTLSIAAAPTTAGTSLGVGLAITLPLSMVSENANQQIKKHDQAIRKTISSATHDLLFNGEDGQYVKDLQNISQIEDPVQREEQMEKYVSDVRTSITSMIDDLDVDGEKNSQQEFNTLITDFLSKEVIKNKNLINQTAEEFRSKLKDHLTKIGLNSKEIQKNAKDIQKYAQALQMYKKQTNDALTKVHKYQKGFAKAMNATLSEIGGGVDALVKIEFAKMSPAQKIRALNKGGVLYNVIKEPKRSQLKKEWEDLKNLQEFESNARVVIYGFQTFANIGSKLGISDDIIGPINEAAKIAGPALDIGMGIATENPMQFMNGVNGLLGGQSAGEVRHKQLMKMLKSLVEGQVKILNNQKVMKEQLRQIQNGQVAMFKELSKINDQLKTIDEKLVLTIDAVLYNRKMILALLQDKFSPCNVITHEIIDKSSSFSSEQGQIDIEGVDEILGYYSESEIPQCLRAYQQAYALLSKTTLFSELYSVRSQTSNYHQLMTAQNLYSPMHSLHKAFGQKHYNFSRLSSPVNNITKIDHINTIMDLPESGKGKKILNYFDHQFSLNELMIDFGKFETLAPYLELGWFYEDKKTIRYVRDIEKIYSSMHLAALIPYTQENIISGSILVDKVYTDRTTDSIVNDRVKEALSTNEYFRNNYISYFINQKAKETNKKISSVHSDLVFQRSEKAKEFFKDLGYGLNLIYSDYGTRVQGYIKDIDALKAQYAANQKSIKKGIEDHDKEIFGELDDFTAADVNDYYKYVNSLLDDVKKDLEAILTGEDKAKIVKAGIEHTIIDDKLAKFYALPYDLSLKYNTFMTVLQDAKAYSKLKQEIYLGIDRKEVFWVENEAKEVFLLPLMKDVMNGKVHRRPQFEKAFNFMEYAYGKHAEYRLQYKTMLKKDDNFKKVNFNLGNQIGGN